MRNKYVFPTDETRCIDEAICPQCGYKFDPEKHKLSEEGHEYETECTNCGKLLHIFESIEYQIELAQED